MNTLDNPPSTFKILAVDDTPDNLFLLESLLSEDERYQLQFAEDGIEALEFINNAPPDLILLDVMMPGLSGYDVTRKIRGNSSLPYIPILLLTAHDQSSLVEGLDAGADDFLRKPFDVDELLARVRSMVRLKQSIDAYRFMVQQRDDFMARLTHDLRTPLVAANRVLKMCGEGTFGAIADTAKEALDNVVENNANLLAMSNTLLEVYRHDAGQKQLNRTEISMRSLCQSVVSELAPLAEMKGVALVSEGLNADVGADADSSHPYAVNGDAIELRRLITNLVGNAIKFTEKGQITVRLRVSEGTSADPKHCSIPVVLVDIEDTGPGISEEELRQIFAWFRQGDHLKTGSGLGLHLAQRIARLHSGKITAHSVLGEGSTFTVELPSILS